ncbi:spermine oxidase-like [Haliotis cracherodii]|uniref:spermine oxidase-like n=1 Tax=Haliotis cracherodii TaxID=6455 RepID=UPI0039ECE2E2
MASVACRVVVIGGGLAGLSAAEHLKKAGVTGICVLEASHRCGGRMKTMVFGEGIVELGANWIHGATLSNSVFTLAAQNNLLYPYVLLDRMEGYCYTSDGRVIDPHLTNRVWTVYQAIERDLQGLSSRGSDGLGLPLESWFNNKLQKAMVLFETQEQEDARAVMNCLLNLVRFHNGGFLDDTDTHLISLYEELPGGEVKLPRGCASILNAMLHTLPQGTVQCNTEVTNIRLNTSGLTPNVEVTCRNGSRVVADHVIVTCSLGFLKRQHHTLFSPPLPRHKVHAIENIGFGIVGKIFLYYKTPFWVRGHGGIKLCWQGHESRLKGKEEWYKKIFAFDEVLNNPGVLVAWLSGAEVAYMERLPLQEVADVCSNILKSFLGNPCLPSPTRVCRSGWSDNPYICGSYSYPTTSDPWSLVPHLLQPVCTSDQAPRILFAGEATHPSFFSTMHGARSSGLREANRIIAWYNTRPKL